MTLALKRSLIWTVWIWVTSLLTLVIGLLWFTPPLLLAPGWLFGVMFALSISLSVVAARENRLEAAMRRYRGTILGFTCTL